MKPSRPVTLIDVVRENIRLRHYSLRTEKAYVGWTRRFVRFCGQRHPRDLGTSEITTFLTHLAVDLKVTASTQNQALQSLIFLYREVLKIDLPDISQVVRAAKPQRLPVVLTREEVQRVFAQLEGRAKLVVGLMYGSGLRLSEALAVRVKDLDLERRELLVRHGKGGKDRVTVIPERMIQPLKEHLDALRAWYRRERQAGAPGISLPHALKRKYPDAHLSWTWQWLFPSRTFCRDPYDGTTVRYQVHPKTVQRTVQWAVARAGIAKPASCHVKTTQIYTHVLNRGGNAIRSPLDGLI